MIRTLASAAEPVVHSVPSRLAGLIGPATVKVVTVTPRRLMMVEDDASLGRALARLLRSYGHEVYAAGSCAEARAASGRFSLGVFDVDLPDGDGIELARELLEAGVVKRAVFFTGALDKSIVQRAVGYGPVVTKARGVAVLRIAIETQLEGVAVGVVGGDAQSAHPTSTAPPPSRVKKR